METNSILLNRILLFDGSYMLHRNLAQPNNWDMINSKGKRTGGIFGVLRTLYKELKTYNYYPIVVFDGGLSKRRLEIYSNYKKNEEKQLLLECKEEEKTEEQLLSEEFMREYSTQRNDLIQLLPLFGIPTIRLQTWEGDDLLYIISKMTKNCIVVSDDKDLIQLLHNPIQNDNRSCYIRRPLKDEFLDIQYFENLGIDRNTFIGCKAIVGDPSDNIPSACFQVGEKTALGLYKLYIESIKMVGGFPTTEEELSNKCKQLGITKRKAYLNFNEDQFLKNVLLTDLSLVDSEIDNNFIMDLYSKIREDFSTLNVEKIIELLKEYEINTFDINALLSRINDVKCYLDMDLFEQTIGTVEINVPDKPKTLLGI